MNLQNFFQSTLGQILVVILIVLLFAIILFSKKNKDFSAKELAVNALLVALSTILSYLVLFSAPYGGSVTLVSMFPIILAGYIFGIRAGIIVGLSVGLLNLILNPYIIHPLQLLLDYPLAFSSLGFGALFRNKGKFSLLLATWIGILGRFVCAFLSGIIFFASYAPEGFNPYLYSALYNASYLIAEGAIITVIISIPSVKTSIDRLKNAY